MVEGETLPIAQDIDPRGMIYATLKRAYITREMGGSGIAEMMSLLDLTSSGLRKNDRWDEDMKAASKMRNPTKRFHFVLVAVIRLMDANRLWLRQARFIERGEEWDEAF